MILLRLLVATLVVAASASAQVDSKAEAYYNFCLGRSYESQNQPQHAIEAYRKAAEADPRSGEIQLALAELFMRLNRSTDAINAARKAVEVDPDLAAGHRLLGKIYSQMMSADAKDTLAQFALTELKEAARIEPDDTESLLVMAQIHLRRGETEEAARALESLLGQDPDSYYALFLLAEIRRAEGKTAEATELFRRAVEAEPRFERSYTGLAALYEEQGEFQKAVDVYRQSLEVSPSGSRLPLAGALARSGQLQEAAAEFESALEVDPDSGEALYGLALVRRELKNLDGAEALLTKLLAAEPDNLSARFALVQVYEDKRQLPKAIAEIELLLKKTDESSQLAPAAKRERRARFLVTLGLAHEQMENYPKAVEAFEKAYDESGKSSPFDVYLAQSYLTGGRLEDAARLVETSLGKTPDSRELHLLKVQILQKQGSEKEAFALMESMRAKAPDDVELLAAFADVYRRAKRLSEAEGVLAKALQVAPDNEAILFQLGAVLERQKKFDDAESAFKKVLAKNPKSSPTLNYLGYMLADRGVRLEESLGYLKTAVALDPYNGSYLDSLGWAYFKLGELEHARENLLKAVQNLRETGVVYDHLGDVFLQLGQPEEAVRYWQKALERDDEDLEKDAVERKIDLARKSTRMR